MTRLDSHLFEGGLTSCTTARQQWPQCLAGFSDRNRKRRVVLETERRHIGAQTTAARAVLTGICYDRKDGRVHIMLDGDDVEHKHRTHSISSVASVDTLSDPSGRDVALRIRELDGQTLLTFVP
jgi:acylphosphatase